MRRLVERWRKRQRRIDREVLWPSIRSIAPDPERAKLAFLLHVSIDSAWRGVSDDELKQVFKELDDDLTS